jgi:hypothetical protein
MACVVHRDGERIVVDTSHPAYPRRRAVRKASGPGTELKKLLAMVGITAKPNCSCNAKARTMDANGCDWCEANLDEIVGWLREEATKRGLPFLDAAGRVLVRRAISNARKEAARAEKAAQAEGENA